MTSSRSPIGPGLGRPTTWMLVVLSLALAWAMGVSRIAQAADDSRPFTYGEWKYFTFNPRVEASLATGQVVINIYIPCPPTDDGQKLVRCEQVPAGKANLYQDVNKLNQIFERKMTLAGGRTIPVGFDAVVGVRNKIFKRPADKKYPLQLSSKDRRELRPFLKHGKSTGQGQRDIKKIVDELSKDQTDALVLAKRLFDATRYRLTYKRKNDFKGAAKTWADREGECGDYAAVFVSLCRYAGIPARPIAGWEWNGRGWDNHIWAEFYLQDAGWIPCDPSHADNESGNPLAENHSVETNFGQVDTPRLAMTRGYDLRFTKPRRLKCDVLQSYLWEALGRGTPTVQWSLTGKPLESPPAATSSSTFDPTRN